jgi:hypothetical protein
MILGGGWRWDPVDQKWWGRCCLELQGQGMDDKERAAVKAALEAIAPAMARVDSGCVVCAEELANDDQGPGGLGGGSLGQV